jgi:hypothetical protein
MECNMSPMIQSPVTKAYWAPQFPPNWGCWVAGCDIKCQSQYENKAQKKKIEERGDQTAVLG